MIALAVVGETVRTQKDHVVVCKCMCVCFKHVLH